MADLAAERLDALGFRARVHCRDGASGDDEDGPFDRIIATASVWHVPERWLESLHIGGRLVVDLRGTLGEGGVMLLDRRGPSLWEGVFSGVEVGGFMPLRGGRDPHGTLDRCLAQPPTATLAVPSTFPPDLLVDFGSRGSSLRWFVECSLGACLATEIVRLDPDRDDVTLDVRPTFLLMHDRTALSFFQIESGWQVTVYGQPAALDRLVAAHIAWVAAGRPERHAFRWVASASHDQRLVLDGGSCPSGSGGSCMPTEFRVDRVS